VYSEANQFEDSPAECGSMRKTQSPVSPMLSVGHGSVAAEGWLPIGRGRDAAARAVDWERKLRREDLASGSEDAMMLVAASTAHQNEECQRRVVESKKVEEHNCERVCRIRGI
jgi:hypothetical protein